MANLGWGYGSEQGGYRPVIILQNNVGNRYSNTVTIAPVSSKTKRPLPTHVIIRNNDGNLGDTSVVLLEQIRTIDKARLTKHIGVLSSETMAKIEEGIMCEFDILQKNNKNS